MSSDPMGTDPLAAAYREEHAMSSNGRLRHIEFPTLQTHDRRFELAMVVLSIVCMIVVLIIVLATNLGTEFRPKV